MTQKTDYSGLQQLGQKTDFPSSPDEAVLERVSNPHLGTDYAVRFVAPEFTSLCPLTGQPDFAHLVLDYVPNEWLIESKSLKLFLTSFRNHGDFHEACTISIAKRIEEITKPKWLRLGGYWYPRGGIPIDIFYENKKAPKNIYIPPTGIKLYQGR